MDEWNMLYSKALELQGEKKLSKFLKIKGVSAALLTRKGNIYVGVSLDSSCAIGMCAERNAIANMLTNGENSIYKILAVKDNGKIISPCAVCRECMLQLGMNNKQTQVMVAENKVMTLEELVPNWWGDQVENE